MSLFLVMKDNFASMTNILGCVITNGTLDFIVDEAAGEDFWITPLGTKLMEVYQTCDLQTLFDQLAKHFIGHFHDGDEAKASDVFKDIQFFVQIAK